VFLYIIKRNSYIYGVHKPVGFYALCLCRGNWERLLT